MTLNADLAPIQHEYSDTVIKAFKCLREPPILPEYIKSKNKERHTMINFVKNEIPNTTKIKLAKYNLMSVTELSTELENAQKEKIMEYVQKKKLYMKSMMDHNFNQ
mmetsp:Transcript_8175/g.7256  ORF Transcript_8175/g.7256 Transcript_8175/m.7256 type:complete len:106 (+) Transcript_8175:518-835(+)